ncbi:MAG: hypothetical protein WBD46_16145 [Acidobacteriaceae bacterium]
MKQQRPSLPETTTTRIKKTNVILSEASEFVAPAVGRNNQFRRKSNGPAFLCVQTQVEWTCIFPQLQRTSRTNLHFSSPFQQSPQVQPHWLLGIAT